MKALILWHYLDEDGKTINASTTLVEDNSVTAVQDRINEEFAENQKPSQAQKTIVHQILILEL